MEEELLDMFEEIEMNVHGKFDWANQNFIQSIRSQIDRDIELTELQCQAIENIYAAKK